jgi:hypothetical protein
MYMAHACLSDDIHKARTATTKSEMLKKQVILSNRKTIENTRSCHILVHFCCFLIGEQEWCDIAIHTPCAHLNQPTLPFTRFTSTGKNDINVAKVIFIILRPIWLLWRTSPLPNNCSLLSRAVHKRKREVLS